jgi:antitoxin component of MazEF toxin-antitoxin module
MSKRRRNDDLVAKVRTIFRSGESLCITLPKKFVVKHGLKPGDRIPVIANSILKAIPMQEVE